MSAWSSWTTLMRTVTRQTHLVNVPKTANDDQTSRLLQHPFRRWLWPRRHQLYKWEMFQQDLLRWQCVMRHLLQQAHRWRLVQYRRCVEKWEQLRNRLRWWSEVRNSDHDRDIDIPCPKYSYKCATVRDIICKYPPGVNLNIAPLLTGKTHFTKQEAKACYRIGHSHIHVECANARIKTYEIVHHFPRSYRSIATKIFQLCTCLVNGQMPEFLYSTAWSEYRLLCLTLTLTISPRYSPVHFTSSLSTRHTWIVHHQHIICHHISIVYPDWDQFCLPCKHMLAVFCHGPGRRWNKLPDHCHDFAHFNLYADVVGSLSHQPDATTDVILWHCWVMWQWTDSDWQIVGKTAYVSQLWWTAGYDAGNKEWVQVLYQDTASDNCWNFSTVPTTSDGHVRCCMY